MSPEVTVREVASDPMVAYLYEHSVEFPGVTIGRAYIRHYPYQQLAAQVLGYVSSITQAELRHLGKGYDLNDELGQSGDRRDDGDIHRGCHRNRSDRKRQLQR